MRRWVRAAASWSSPLELKSVPLLAAAEPRHSGLAGSA